MKWLKRMAVILLCVLAFAAYLLWPVVFPKNPEEVLAITLQSRGVSRQFHIKRGYLEQPDDGAVRGHILLKVGYPDGGFEPPWSRDNGPRRMRMVIEIAPPETSTERMVREWQERGHLPDRGPGFDRFVGRRDGYDFYETLPNPKTGDVYKSKVFTDHEGHLVGELGWSAHARMLGDLDIEYGTSRQHKADSRDLRIWAENFVRKILSPPLPPLDPASIKKSPKG